MANLTNNQGRAMSRPTLDKQDNNEQQRTQHTAMKLITKELRETLKRYPLYSQDGKGADMMCLARFFTPMSNWTWYVLEADLEEGEFFGLVDGYETEMGYFTLEELEGWQKSACGLERDLYFKPKKLRDIHDQCVRDYVATIWPEPEPVETVDDIPF